MRRIACALSLLLYASPASAYTLVEDERLTLNMLGWAQAGVALEKPLQGDPDQRVFLGLARLVGQVIYKGWGSAFLQVEANGQGVTLLDVVAELRPVDAFMLRVGQFRLPTSIDVMIAAPWTPMVRRSLLVNLVPRRMPGIEAEARQKYGGIETWLRVGWFIPLSFDDGGMLSFSVDTQLDFGLGVHVAYADFLGERRTQLQFPANNMSDVNTAYDQRLDVGLTFKRDGWSAWFEGVISFDHDEPTRPMAAYVMLMKDIPIADPISLEPGARYDIIRAGNQVRHRITAALNLFFVKEFLNTSVNYELLFADGDNAHTVLLQIQAGY